jgi:hypothetical protein
MLLADPYLEGARRLTATIMVLPEGQIVADAMPGKNPSGTLTVMAGPAGSPWETALGLNSAATPIVLPGWRLAPHARTDSGQ